MKNTYYTVLASFPSQFAEQLQPLNILAMRVYGCSGVEEYSLNEPTVDEFLGEKSYGGGNPPDEVLEEVETKVLSFGHIQYIYYFDKGDSESLAKDWCQYVQSLHRAISAKTLAHEIEDWNANWRKNYEPIEVSQNFSIIPSWLKNETQGEGIYIYPGQGFGTGQHETTLLCLKLLLQLNNVEFKTCLDFGCGSGILGLATYYFHRNCQVDLYDIDQEALENCEQNLEHNSWQHVGEFRVLSPKNKLDFLHEYDLVFANILKKTLIEEKEVLFKHCKQEGYLILSGLLKEQAEEIVNLYSDFQLIQRVTKNDWCALLMKKQ